VKTVRPEGGTLRLTFIDEHLLECA
jgi:hypothetical protein